MIASRTTINKGVSKHTVSLKDQIVTIGSCFADAIGKKLDRHKFAVCQNPFGTTYNPHSIHKALGYAIHNLYPESHSFVQNQDIHLHYDFHSCFSSLDKQELITTLKNTIESVQHSIKTASLLIITYGTAWVYERVETGEVVANCHKMPGNLFRKSLITQKRIIESFDQVYKELKVISPDLRIILTVSPVRHIKDTLELNAVSKSILRATCHSLVQTYPDVEYFPAYEIMLDDLRDYRFYKQDMIHPTEEAEDYIWQLFVEKYINDETKTFIERWDRILKALHHKTFHPASQSNQLFLRDTLKKLEELKSTVDVTNEIAQVKSQLI